MVLCLQRRNIFVAEKNELFKKSEEEKSALRDSIAERHSHSLQQLKTHFESIKSQEEAIRHNIQNENIILKGEYESVLKAFQSLKLEYDIQQEKFANQLKNVKDKFERQLTEMNMKNIAYQSQLQKEFAQKVENMKVDEKKRIAEVYESSNMEKQALIDSHLQEADILASQLNREFKQQTVRTIRNN